MTDDPGIGHNSGRIDIKMMVEAIEALEEEKSGVSEKIKAKWKALKAAGAPADALKHVMRLRKKTEDERQSFEASVQILKAVLGMLGGVPLGPGALRLLEEQYQFKHPSPDQAATDHAARELVNKPLDLPDESPAEQQPDMPKDTLEQAREKGGDAARAGKSIVQNPYPYKDQDLRASWEEGWCMVTGSVDGIEIPVDWLNAQKEKNGKPDTGTETGTGTDANTGTGTDGTGTDGTIPGSDTNLPPPSPPSDGAGVGTNP
jgi:uncharacterized protein (UPF0335 family)/ribosome modulation factor